MNIKQDLKQFKNREILINTLQIERSYLENNSGIAAIQLEERTGPTNKTGDPTGSTALRNIDRINELTKKILSLIFKQERLKAYLEILTDDEKQIIYYRYMYKDNITWQEIASKINCSYGTARTKYFRALEKLECLQNTEVL